MAHDYSVLIHDWLTQKIDIAETEIKTAHKDNESEKILFFQGHLEELIFLRKYLTDQIDLETQNYYR